MKRMLKKKSVPALLLIIGLLLTAVMPVSAATQKKKIYTMKEDGNLSVILFYDKEEPTAVLEGPSGSFKEGDEKLKVERQAGSLTLKVYGAKAGDWSLSYDKKSNKQVTAVADVFLDPPKIKAFTVKPKDEKQALMEASYEFEGPDASHRCSVSVGIQNAAGETVAIREMAYGNENPGKHTMEFSMKELEDSDRYVFRLTVERSKGEAHTYESMETVKGYSFKNPTNPAFPGEVRLEYHPEAREGILVWTGIKADDIRHFEAGVYDAEGTFLDFQTIEKEYSRYAVSVPDGTKMPVTFRILGVTSDGNRSKTVLRRVPTEDFPLKRISGDLINYPELAYFNETENAYEVRISDGTQEQRVVAEPGRKLLIPLREGENDIQVKVKLKDGIYVVDDASVIYDATAPLLRLNHTDVKLDAGRGSFLIAGKTEPGAKVLIDGKETEVDGDGLFHQEVSVGHGRSEVAVVAKDAAGNGIERTVSFVRGAEGGHESGSAAGWMVIPMATIVGLTAWFCYQRQRAVYQMSRPAGRTAAIWQSITLWIFPLLVAAVCNMIYRTVGFIRTLQLTEGKGFLQEVLVSGSELIRRMQEAGTVRRQWITALVLLIVVLAAYIADRILWRRRCKKIGMPVPRRFRREKKA